MTLESGALRRFDVQSARTAIAPIVFVVCCTSCSIRYDAAGVTRVGVGLWGFGDPPGVQWNLEPSRREIPELLAGRRRDIPELPAAPRIELPPRTMSQQSSHGARLPFPYAKGFDESEMPIEDNHACASRGLTYIACLLARSTLARGPDSARR